MKTKVKVNLVTLSIYELPEGALELIDWATNLLKKVPEQYRSSIQIEFSDYDNNKEMEMDYYRPETEEELAARKAKELHYKKEQEELQLLAKLKAKYEQQV